ncbi:hypothetical protein SEA_RIZWANA_88 [Arthrobacter phage Rizwana]|nr:hypothetical protein SEA_RIZWANA_88 [Arthrobacter phage Rizwana]
MSATTVHYRLASTTANLTKPTACSDRGFSTTDVQAVTCLRCHHSDAFQSALAEFTAVTEALAYPKEEHPCLSTSSPVLPRSMPSAGTGASSPLIRPGSPASPAGTTRPSR